MRRIEAIVSLEWLCLRIASFMRLMAAMKAVNLAMMITWWLIVVCNVCRRLRPFFADAGFYRL